MEDGAVEDWVTYKCDFVDFSAYSSLCYEDLLSYFLSLVFHTVFFNHIFSFNYICVCLCPLQTEFFLIDPKQAFIQLKKYQEPMYVEF